jgi:hypothetical protein
LIEAEAEAFIRERLGLKPLEQKDTKSETRTE